MTFRLILNTLNMLILSKISPSTQLSNNNLSQTHHLTLRWNSFSFLILQEVLQFIEERLTELEREKEELTEYEQLDKSRRALEYNLYDKELTKATEQLGHLEANREAEREKQQELFTALREIQVEFTFRW